MNNKGSWINVSNFLKLCFTSIVYFEEFKLDPLFEKGAVFKNFHKNKNDPKMKKTAPPIASLICG